MPILDKRSLVSVFSSSHQYSGLVWLGRRVKRNLKFETVVFFNATETIGCQHLRAKDYANEIPHMKTLPSQGYKLADCMFFPLVTMNS